MSLVASYVIYVIIQANVLAFGLFYNYMQEARCKESTAV